MWLSPTQKIAFIARITPSIVILPVGLRGYHVVRSLTKRDYAAGGAMLAMHLAVGISLCFSGPATTP